MAGPARRRTRCSPSRARIRRRRWRRCGVSRCRRGTRSAPPTSRPAASARCWRWRTSAICATSRRSCCSSSSARARSSRWRWSPRWCTARRRASRTRPASRSRTAARTAIPSRCRCGSTTSRLPCSERPSTRPDWDTPTSSTAWRAWTRSRAGSSGAAIRTRTSTRRSPTSARSRPALGGRTVFDDRPAPRRRATSAHGQLSLFPK